MLADTVKDENASASMTLARMQGLAAMGAGRLAIRTIACNDVDLLCRSGLRLGIALLRAGGTSAGQRVMQENLYKVLMSMGTDPASAAAIDGTHEGFLGTIRNRLRLGIKEITDRKIYLATQSERRLVLAETDNVSRATLASMIAENNKEFPTRAFVLDVLELLQALVEGHNESFQNYLRDQPDRVYDIDIISEVVGLAQAIEPELDAQNIDQLHACISFLTEAVQGESSRENARLLLYTKLLIVADRLLTKFPFDSEVTIEAITALRSQVLALLHALLEGNDASMVERMCYLLDVNALAEVAYEWYAPGASAVAGGDNMQPCERRLTVSRLSVSRLSVGRLSLTSGGMRRSMVASGSHDDDPIAEAKRGNARQVYMLLWQLLDPSVYPKVPNRRVAYSFLEDKVLHE